MNFKVYESGYDANNASFKDQDELKTYLKKYVSAKVNLNVLLGSGSSLPAIKTMDTTFKKLKSENLDVSTMVDKYKESDLAKNDRSGENIETFLSWISSRIEGLLHSELQDNEVSVKEKVKNGLIQSILNGSIQHDNPDSEITKTKSNYSLFFKNLAFIKELSDDKNDTINVFTPNYDLFIEGALDSLGYTYSDGFRNGASSWFDITEYNRRPVDITKRFRDKWSIVRPFFRVYKLHGSLNWIRDDKFQKVTKDYNLRDKKVEEVSNSLIAPTSSKYADSQGFPFSDLFREFSIELGQPNSILLVNGYGFGDEHINSFILQGLGRPDFKLIAFVDEDNENTKRFMNEVGHSAGATFITDDKTVNSSDDKTVNNSDDKTVNNSDDKAFYFKTMIELLSYHDPFEEQYEDEN